MFKALRQATKLNADANCVFFRENTKHGREDTPAEYTQRPARLARKQNECLKCPHESNHDTERYTLPARSNAAKAKTRIISKTTQ